MTKQFNIRDYVEFDGRNRAQCPQCLTEGKTSRNLSVLESGAYKCFRGCTPQQIREALGAKPDATVPAPQITRTAPPKNVLLSPAKVKAATDALLNKGKESLDWLEHRGINTEMIRHYRLGYARARVGDSTRPNGFTHLPCIAIALPNHDSTAYFHKKRVRPWKGKSTQPDGYSAWSQYGIPSMVYTTHQPENPSETWLCEGEWDAIVLGWAVRKSEYRDYVQVSCFTTGAGNVPPAGELEKLSGDVISFYDRDEAGDKGVQKLGARLGDRLMVATVPCLNEPPSGWDITDAMMQGLFPRICESAKQARRWEPPREPNPLRDRLVSNDVMLANAPDYTDWLVDDILTADELFLLAASPRAGKSLLALTLTHAVASGGKFLGRPVSQGAVIYIRCEDSDTKTKERELKQGWGDGLPVYWLDKFKLNELSHLEELVDELDARLVVFDTLSRVRDGAISESSAEMSQQLEPLQEMCKRTRCCGLLVHHTGKVSLDNAGTINVYDTIRGSSAIRATCRGTLILAADEQNYRLHVENGWGKLDLQVLLDAHTLTWKLLGNWVGPNVDLSQKDRVLQYLTQVGRATIDEIAEASNLPRRSLYEVLKRLQSDELIEKHGERKSAVYIKSTIQQLAVLNSALNKSDQKVITASNPDTARDTENGNMSDTKTLEPLPDKAFNPLTPQNPQKAIQLIQQLNSVLNSCNPDREIFLTPIQQLHVCGGTPGKSDHFSKSDHGNDHFFEKGVPPTPWNLLTKTPESPPDKAYAIQHPIQHNSTSSKKVILEKENNGISKGFGRWCRHVELDTVVELVKQGKEQSTVKVPGLGRRRVSNALLEAVDYDEEA